MLDVGSTLNCTIDEIKSAIKVLEWKMEKLQGELTIVDDCINILATEIYDKEVDLIIEERSMQNFKKEEENKGVNKPITDTVGSKIIKKKRRRDFDKYIISFLEDDIPKSGRDLYDLYIQKTNKIIKYHSFSGMLSELVHSIGIIKMYYFKKEHKKPVHFYCKSEWFIGNSLKPEYESKLLNHKKEINFTDLDRKVSISTTGGELNIM